MGQKICDGTWVTMITPFTGDHKIDYPGVANIIEWYIEKKIDGIFAVCQSSEMFYLSLKERVQLAKFVIDHVAGRVPVVVSGHVSESLEDQIEELSSMAALTPQAVVLVSNRLARRHESDEVWKKNAQAILDAVPHVKLGIYECPYPYKRLMSGNLLKWCAETGRFAFLKDTCCNIDQLQEKIALTRDTPLKIFNANSATLLESLKLGGAGFCGVMLNFHPELYGWLCKNWEKDPEKAQKLQDFAAVASLIELQNYPTNAKYHMFLSGVPIGLVTRSKDYAGFQDLQKSEVQALYRCWRNYYAIL